MTMTFSASTTTGLLSGALAIVAIIAVCSLVTMSLVAFLMVAMGRICTAIGHIRVIARTVGLIISMVMVMATTLRLARTGIVIHWRGITIRVRGTRRSSRRVSSSRRIGRGIITAD